MKRAAVIHSVVIILFAAQICHADSLVITYRSGKTQAVVLDEPSQGVSSWQFVGGTASQQHSKKPGDGIALPEQELVEKERTINNKRLTEKAPERKSNIRVKWDARPIAD